MTYIDIIIIILILLGLTLGYSEGIYKTILDIFVLFISMVISSIVSKPISESLYSILPFIKIGGLYSVNLIIYRLIVYLLICLIIFGIYQFILRKTEFDDKLVKENISLNIFVRIIGSILGMPFVILILYNVMLFVNLPIINLNGINNSLLVPRIIERTVIVSNNNIDLYMAEEDTKSIISEYEITKKKNTKEDIEITNDLVEIGFVSSNTVDKLRKKGSLK